MTELQKYYASLVQEVTVRQLANEDGDSQEQTFTRYVVDMLSEAGETENVDVAYYDKDSGTVNQTKINAYALPENYETVDLFITLYKPEENIPVIYASEIQQAQRRTFNFFKKSFCDDLYLNMADSSEVIEFSKTLATYEELRDSLIRVNVFILTNGEYKGEIPSSDVVDGHNIYYRVIDINFIYGISKESRIPIEIDFDEYGYSVPCLPAYSENEDYQAYVSIISGSCLADLYERFGARLMEQNVRTFLQFTGKINKGIRETINKEPHMFLAFNNGIAATADHIEMDPTGRYIKKMSNLQIVNGGQTTASIYHTKKQDKADVSQVFVQVKLSVVKKKEQFSEIVSRISRYANTQNKVNDADFSANNPILVELEKLSRYIMTPAESSGMQTYWFFERARGQYKNARKKDGFTKSREKAFDLKYPKSQLFTKVELAKYVNSWEELEKTSNGKKKLLIAPYIVVRGNEKNYAAYINYNLPKDVDNVYFEDVVAKAILFRDADRRYGTKRNEYCIGELKQVVVPYALGLVNILTKGKIDLYKIWKKQAISKSLSDEIYNLMVQVNRFILDNSPGSHYIEWAKKEECWDLVKKQEWLFDLDAIRDDLIDPKNTSKRKSSKQDVDFAQREAEYGLIKAIPPVLWNKIAEYGRDGGYLDVQQQIYAKDIAHKLVYCQQLDKEDRQKAIEVYEIVADKNVELLEEAESFAGQLLSRMRYEVKDVNRLLAWNESHKSIKTNMVNELKKVVKGATFDSKLQCIFAMAIDRAKVDGYQP